MKPQLDSAELELLQSANDMGRIDLPSASGEEIERCLNVLLQLQKVGYVSRMEGFAFYRPFVLTAVGRTAMDQNAGENCRV